MDVNSFNICWGEVDADASFPNGWKVSAIWPAPVNDDECFAAAGFCEFQSNCDEFDEADWDERADRMHLKIVSFLSGLGEVEYLSFPRNAPKPWYRFWQESEWLPAHVQLDIPMQDDNQPDCVLRFGGVAQIRCGSGHRFYWLGFAPDCPVSLSNLLAQLAPEGKVRRVDLDWQRLGSHRA